MEKVDGSSPLGSTIFPREKVFRGKAAFLTAVKSLRLLPKPERIRNRTGPKPEQTTNEQQNDQGMGAASWHPL